MALPALDEAFASLEGLPKREILAQWLVNKTGSGLMDEYVAMPERYIWAKLAVAYGGSFDESAYRNLAKQYAWSGVYNGITGGSDIYLSWNERMALAEMVAAVYNVDLCCDVLMLPVKYLLALMALSTSPAPVEVDGLAFDDGIDSGALLYDDGDTGLLLYA